MNAFLTPLRCELYSYSFLGFDLGHDPYWPLAVIFGIIMVGALFHLFMLQRRAALFWWQALVTILAAGGALVFSLIKVPQGELSCDGLGDPSSPIISKVATDDIIIKALVIISYVLIALLVENALATLFQGEWRFQHHDR